MILFPTGVFFLQVELQDLILKLTEYLKNGPYLEKLIEEMMQPIKTTFDIIHTSFFPYFNIILTLLLGKLTDTPTVCTV